MNDIVVECKNLLKIFGHQADRALVAIHEEGLGKAEVLERFQCVVGVANASFTVSRGERFCIMAEGFRWTMLKLIQRNFTRIEKRAGALELSKNPYPISQSTVRLKKLRCRR